MAKRIKCMFDTNIFDWIVKNDTSLVETLAECVEVYATYIQQDELDRTPGRDEKAKRAKLFVRLVPENAGSDRPGKVPTESAMWGISKWGSAKWGSGDGLRERIHSSLDTRKKKPNNAEDSLIAETAIKNDFLLVTNDGDLKEVAQEHGGESICLRELLLQCKKSLPSC